MKLKEIRERAGMSQAALAAQLEATSQTVGRWESGKIEMTSGRLIAAAQLLGCSVDELLGYRPVGYSTPVIQPGFWEERGTHWGWLKVEVAGQRLAYPVSLNERLKVTRTVAQLEQDRLWAEVQTLNNRLLLLRWDNLDGIDLIETPSDQTLSFVEEAAFHALAEAPDLTNNEAVSKAAAILGDDQDALLNNFCIRYKCGRCVSGPLTEHMALELDHLLPMQDASAYVEFAESDRGRAHVALLKNTALIELPKARFRKLQDAYWDAVEKEDALAADIPAKGDAA